jgi:hypothetical protein
LNWPLLSSMSASFTHPRVDRRVCMMHMYRLTQCATGFIRRIQKVLECFCKSCHKLLVDEVRHWCPVFSLLDTMTDTVRSNRATSSSEKPCARQIPSDASMRSIRFARPRRSASRHPQRRTRRMRNLVRPRRRRALNIKGVVHPNQR